MILEVRQPTRCCRGRDFALLFHIIAQTGFDPLDHGSAIGRTGLILFLGWHVLVRKGIEYVLPTFKFLTGSEIASQTVHRNFTFALIRAVALNAIRLEKGFDMRLEASFSLLDLFPG